MLSGNTTFLDLLTSYHEAKQDFIDITPGFAEQVESGWGSVCIPNTFWGCHTVNPYQDKFNEYRSNNTLFDNRGSVNNSGVWLNWNGGTELLTWDAEDFGNRIILIVKERMGTQPIPKREHGRLVLRQPRVKRILFSA